MPTRPPDRMYGGRGTGARCAICRAIIARDEMELELVFRDNQDGERTYYAHQRCYSSAHFGQTSESAS
jgi:hypothetical protein